MVKAKDIMTKEVITASPEMEIAEAAKMLLDNSINGMPVIDESGDLTGIICQSDLIVQQKQLPVPSVFTLLDGVIPLISPKNLERGVQKIVATTVAQAMTSDPLTIHTESSIEEIAKLMVDKKIHTLPVVKKGKLVGIVGKEDVLRTLLPEKL
ncbi:MAG: CBS domain-containing protein [Thermodesulfobacteriota bacterium]|nr:CBS domain-containing protein [Thermodesulfobacteriota bacterium]